MDHDALGAVLFDLDGVLTPTAEKHMQAWNRMFTEFFAEREVAVYTDADYFDYLDGKPRAEGVTSLLAARGLEECAAEPELVEQLGERKNRIFLRLLAEGIVPYPGSVRYLDALDAARIPSAVVSSSQNARGVLEAAGLGERFSVIVDGALAGAEGLPGKPQPDTFWRGAELLGVPAETCLVIEDAVSGVRAGAAGGFLGVVGVDRGAGAAELIRAGADRVVTDLDELLAELPSPGPQSFGGERPSTSGGYK